MKIRHRVDDQVLVIDTDGPWYLEGSSIKAEMALDKLWKNSRVARLVRGIRISIKAGVPEDLQLTDQLDAAIFTMQRKSFKRKKLRSKRESNTHIRTPAASHKLLRKIELNTVKLARAIEEISGWRPRSIHLVYGGTTFQLKQLFPDSIKIISPMFYQLDNLKIEIDGEKKEVIISNRERAIKIDKELNISWASVPVEAHEPMKGGRDARQARASS